MIFKIIKFNKILLFAVLILFLFLIKNNLKENSQKLISVDSQEIKVSINKQNIYKNETNNIVLGFNEDIYIEVDGDFENVFLDNENIIEYFKKKKALLPFTIKPSLHEIRVDDIIFFFNFFLKDSFEDSNKSFNSFWVVPDSTNINSWEISDGRLALVKLLNNEGGNFVSLASRYKLEGDSVVAFSLKKIEEDSQPILYFLNSGDTFIFYDNKICIKESTILEECFNFNFNIGDEYKIEISRENNDYLLFVDEELIFSQTVNFINDIDNFGVGSWSNSQFEIDNFSFGMYEKK